MIRIFLFSLLLLPAACCKEPVSVCNDVFLQAVIELDEAAIAGAIDDQLADLSPIPTSTDEIGHEKNLKTLVDQLNSCAQINAEIRCYACIKTLPVQSEISLTVDSSGTLVTRIADLSTPEDGPMTVLGFH